MDTLLLEIGSEEIPAGYITPALEALASQLHQRLTEARIDDLVLIRGAGAYCAAMPAKNYNSFPEAAEVMVTTGGDLKLIRTRQTLDQILANELGT